MWNAEMCSNLEALGVLVTIAAMRWIRAIFDLKDQSYIYQKCYGFIENANDKVMPQAARTLLWHIQDIWTVL